MVRELVVVRAYSDGAPERGRGKERRNGERTKVHEGDRRAVNKYAPACLRNGLGFVADGKFAANFVSKEINQSVLCAKYRGRKRENVNIDEHK